MTEGAPRGTIRGMSRNRHQSTEPETTLSDEEIPGVTTPVDPPPGAHETPSAGKAAPDAAPSADLKPTPSGQSDPLAQAKISGQAGLRGGSLLAELNALPPIGALEGIRANAQGGYYRTVPAAQLVTDLEGLTFETPEQTAIRDALIERAKGGAYSGA